MLKRSFFSTLIFFIFLTSFISAICEENQIDVNTASLDELDSLYGIGPVKAQAISDARPIASIGSLIDVNGIGPAILEGIKAQNLACVEDGGEENENSDEQGNETGAIVEEEETVTENPKSQYQPIIQPKVIQLNPSDSKDINTEESNEKSSAERYAISGFIAFSILIGFLLLINRKQKNEFR